MWQATLSLLACAVPQVVHAADNCLSDEAIEQALGEQGRSGAFLVDTRTLPVLPLCSGLTLAQQLQRMHDRAFPSELASRSRVTQPAADEGRGDELPGQDDDVAGQAGFAAIRQGGAARQAPHRRAASVAPRRGPACRGLLSQLSGGARSGRGADHAWGKRLFPQAGPGWRRDSLRMMGFGVIEMRAFLV